MRVISLFTFLALAAIAAHPVPAAGAVAFDPSGDDRTCPTPRPEPTRPGAAL